MSKVIEWNGEGVPPKRSSTVKVYLRSGAEFTGMACSFIWRWVAGDESSDIIAYEVIKDE